RAFNAIRDILLLEEGHGLVSHQALQLRGINPVAAIGPSFYDILLNFIIQSGYTFGGFLEYGSCRPTSIKRIGFGIIQNYQRYILWIIDGEIGRASCRERG